MQQARQTGVRDLMSRLFHVSDIHFGAQDEAALDWFAGCVRRDSPDAVVITGDLTMRARSVEFDAAADWIATLGVPVTVEVGNHDLPYYNLFERFFRPYGRYRRVERMVEQPLDLADVAIVPLRTTARAQWRTNWSNGNVGAAALARARRLLAAVPGEKCTLVACHHPLIDQGTRSRAKTRGGAEALIALAADGADAVLSGHVHDPFDIAQQVGERTVRLIGAGTLSERVRDTPPSFNEIVIEGRRLSVIVRAMQKAGPAMAEPAF